MRLLLTGAHGFTGRHFAQAAEKTGYQVIALEGDLQDESAMSEQVLRARPTHVLHLAGISHVTSGVPQDYYQINLLASLALLKALEALPEAPQKVILASSANIYGNNAHSPIGEQETPAPISHYAMSKLAMEYLSRPFLEKLPIVITRPFNYTGVGHGENFVVPKIVDHFARQSPSIELGNTQVLREYNDVRDISQIYLRLLKLGQVGETYNLASGIVHSLDEVIAILERLSGHALQVKTNPQFIRANEIHLLAGDGSKLERCIGSMPLHSLEQTLKWMLDSQRNRIQF